MKKKVVSRIMLTLLLTSALVMLFKPVPYALGSPQVLFEEDFESYAVGSFPSDKFYATWGGWWVEEEGGNKFLRSYGGREVDYLLYTIQKFSGDVTIESMTRHDGGWLYSPCITNSLERMPGAFSFAMSTNGTHYGIYYDYNYGGVDTANSFILGTFTTQPNIWYKVKMTLNSGLAKFYADDTFIFEYNISTVIPFPIENFFLMWTTWGQRDLDNIKVYLPPPTLTITMTNKGSGKTETITLGLVDENHDGFITVDIKNHILAAIRRTQGTTIFDFPGIYTATQGAWTTTLSCTGDYTVTFI